MHESPLSNSRVFETSQKRRRRHSRARVHAPCDGVADDDPRRDDDGEIVTFVVVVVVCGDDAAAVRARARGHATKSVDEDDGAGVRCAERARVIRRRARG